MILLEVDPCRDRRVQFRGRFRLLRLKELRLSSKSFLRKTRVGRRVRVGLLDGWLWISKIEIN